MAVLVDGESELELEGDGTMAEEGEGGVIELEGDYGEAGVDGVSAVVDGLPGGGTGEAVSGFDGEAGVLGGDLVAVRDVGDGEGDAEGDLAFVRTGADGAGRVGGDGELGGDLAGVGEGIEDRLEHAGFEWVDGDGANDQQRNDEEGAGEPDGAGGVLDEDDGDAGDDEERE